jgi:hypothetical protein
VLNSLSGAAIDASLAVVAENGRFVEIGKRGILDPAEVRRRRPDVTYSIVDWTDVAREDPAHIRRHLCEILEGVGSGAIASPPVTRFSLAAAADAFRHMAQARHIGKIVLAVPRAGEAGPPIRPDASYLITGGFGGLGIEVARRLADRGARHLVLMGRHAPSEPAAAALEALRQAGVEVAAVEADVADEKAVTRLVAEIEETGWPLRGIVHAAGTLDNAVLARQDASRFERVMAAKVVGSWHLGRGRLRLGRSGQPRGRQRVPRCAGSAPAGAGPAGRESRLGRLVRGRRGGGRGDRATGRGRRHGPHATGRGPRRAGARDGCGRGADGHLLRRLDRTVGAAVGGR